MKTILRITALGLLAAATALILSCAPAPVSISDTIGSFVSSLNGDRTDTYRYTSSSATDFAAGKDPTVWNALFDPAKAPYSYSSLNDSNSSAVTITLTSGNGPFTYTFGMVNDKNNGSDNWLIKKIIDPTSKTIFD